MAINDYKKQHRSDFQTQFWRTHIFKNSLNNVGTKLYNKLPNHFKNLENLDHFKKKLKAFLLQQNFRPIQRMNTCPKCKHSESEFYGKF